MTTETLSDAEILTQDEQDFSDAGITPQEALFTITSVSREQKEHGVMAKIVLTTLVPGILSFPVTETIWLSYHNPEKVDSSVTTEAIGRSTMKRLYTAVYGVPNGSFEGLANQYVIGWLKEDKNSGRATVSNFKAPTEEQVDAAIDAAGLSGV